jgi:integrase
VVPDKPIPVVPEDALRRLLAACAGKSFEARRDTALVTFLIDTGARRGEVAGLRLADLDPTRSSPGPWECTWGRPAGPATRPAGWPRPNARS